MMRARSGSWRIAAIGTAISVLGLAANGAAAAGPPQPGSPEYVQRDLQNMADANGRQTAPDGQLSATYLTALQQQNPVFLGQQSNQLGDPNRLALTPGQFFPGWNSGNPYRNTWSGTRGITVPVAFTNRYGALLRGDVFAPLPGAKDPYTGKALHAPYPGVVITTGSVQGSERMYWWLAQDLAERGYVVLTYDVQGQGTSETMPHQLPVAELPGCAGPTGKGETGPCDGVPFQQTSNFVYGTEDAIDFFLSTPSKPYKNPVAGATRVSRYNPMWALYDASADPHPATPGRTSHLGIAGHSLGASAVSYVQAVDKRVSAVVALDKLSGSSSFTALGPMKPVVPSLGLQSEYGFNVYPYVMSHGSSIAPQPGAPTSGPDPVREESTGFTTWKKAGVDTMMIVPRASTHLEYTDITLAMPASRYGQDVASYYSQAWFDKYLKHDRAGDARLLATSFSYLEPVDVGVWKPVTLQRADRLSFYYCSGYAMRSTGANDDIGKVGCK
jgi:dienelactone hydrolase